MITKILNELIPISIVFLFASIFAAQWLIRSMIDWQNDPDKSGYIVYSFSWYMGTPFMFIMGWYGTLALIVAGINIWALIRNCFQ